MDSQLRNELEEIYEKYNIGTILHVGIEEAISILSRYDKATKEYPGETGSLNVCLLLARADDYNSQYGPEFPTQDLGWTVGQALSRYLSRCKP